VPEFLLTIWISCGRRWQLRRKHRPLEQLKKNLRRPHLPALDGVRAVAVLLVVLSHAGFHLPVGSLGVLIFFVLSGF